MGRSLWETRCVPMALGQPTYRMANQLLDPGRLLGPAVRGGARSEAAPAPCCTKGRARQRWLPFRKGGRARAGKAAKPARVCLRSTPPARPGSILSQAEKGMGQGLARTRGWHAWVGRPAQEAAVEVRARFAGQRREPKRVATRGPRDATTRHGQTEHGATDNSEAGRQSGVRIKPRT